MLIALLLAGVTRCATAEACPTDAELIAAVQRRNVDRAVAFAKLQSDGGAYVSFHTFPITAVREIHCDAPAFAGQPLGCSFQIRYGRRVEFVVARLVRAGREWSIAEDLSVFRDR